jgi:regulator of sigma E protease
VRAGAVVTLTMTPEVIEDTNQMGRYYFRPILGVMRNGGYAQGPMIRKYYGFFDAAHLSGVQTVMVMGLILEQIGKVFTGEAAVDKSVGGPVEMVRQAKKAAQAGLFSYARLLAGLSLSLGIVNLLPVPVLDGGQLLFFTIEGIRGRPVSAALRERAQQIGVLLLVMLMLTVLILDINRLFEASP